MFTGIITHIGIVQKIEKKGDWRFTVKAPAGMRTLAVGASVACNGCCLTVIKKNKEGFDVQVSGETLSRTTLASWKKGMRINLERALRGGDELGGHFVTGHVDAVAAVEKIEKAGGSKVMKFSIGNRHCREVKPTKQSSSGLPRSLRSPAMTESPESLMRLIAPRGSVTLDGVSLTVNGVAGEGFWVNIIPHTLAATTLGGLKAGDEVNLEIDLIARTLARLSGKL